jgi:hypothetical protein
VKWKTKHSIFAMVALCTVLMLIVSGSNTRTAPRASGELVVPDHLRPIISQALPRLSYRPDTVALVQSPAIGFTADRA